MKCTKCDSEMNLEGFDYIDGLKDSELDYIWKCKCGNVQQSPKVRIDSIALPKDYQIMQIVPTQIAFICQICGDKQPCIYFDKIHFPICDNCKSDLKDFVLSKRKNKPE